jgi:dipeptidyl aminopeptidase/acylaminoacyl peptidase
MRTLSIVAVAVICSLGRPLTAQVQPKRHLEIEDLYRMQQVSDPQCAPDGKWVAYVVTTVDRQADKRRSAVWMVNWEGTQDLRLTYGPESDTSPRWSPDGKYLAFLSARTDGGKTQVWVLDRRGGEARVLTDVKEQINGYAWSPDGKKLVLEMSAGDDDGGNTTKSADAPAKAPKPMVIDRYHFKEDVAGYLTDASRSQLYLFDVESKKLDALTIDKRFDDNDPAWSPDGTRIAYVSNHEKDPDQSGNDEILVIDARPGAMPRNVVTAYAPSGQHLAWSPDGKRIAYLKGLEPKYNAYNQNELEVVPSTGGASRALAQNLDRGVFQPEFTPDGSSITFLYADDRRQYPARVALSAGTVERLAGPDTVVEQQSHAGGRTAVTATTDSAAPEIFALESGKLRKLTLHNDALLSEVQLGAVQDISFKSKDGTEVHGLMTKPPSYEAGKKYPTLLWIHGGPNMQDDHSLPFNTYPLQVERQLFAAHGYVVLAVN